MTKRGRAGPVCLRAPANLGLLTHHMWCLECLKQTRNGQGPQKGLSPASACSCSHRSQPTSRRRPALRVRMWVGHAIPFSARHPRGLASLHAAVGGAICPRENHSVWIPGPWCRALGFRCRHPRGNAIQGQAFGPDPRDSQGLPSQLPPSIFWCAGPMRWPSVTWAATRSSVKPLIMAGFCMAEAWSAVFMPSNALKSY